MLKACPEGLATTELLQVGWSKPPRPEGGTTYMALLSQGQACPERGKRWAAMPGLRVP